MKFKNFVENQTDPRIKKIVNDNGGEYTLNEFGNFIDSSGIFMDFTAPYTPEQNGFSERGNRTTTEKARTLLKQARLPSEFWGEAVSTAVYLENLTPIAKAGFKSPHELWHGDAPSYEHLRVFGCLAYVFIQKESRDGKFSDVAKKGILVGYQGTMKNYRIFLLEEKKVVITHDVRF